MADRDQPIEPLVLSKAEAARLAGVTLPTIDLEISEGKLRVTRIRRRAVIHRDDFEVWLKACRGIVQEGSHHA